MNNIRQVTNFTSEVVSAPQETISVYIGNKEYINVIYYVLSIQALTDLSNTSINKLGYVCEPKGIDYPIIITAGGQTKTFYLDKTGIFEVMPETFLDANDQNAEEIDCIPEITEIKVPKGISGEKPIKFKLDYTYEIN